MKFKNKKISFLKFQNSFTLLEMIISIFILTVGIVGVSALVTYTISLATFSSQSLIAAYLAQEGIEIVRNIRDTNWIEEQTWDNDLLCCISVPCDCEADYTAQTLTDTYTGRFLYIDIDDIDGDGVTNVYRYINNPGFNDIQTKFKRKITISQPATAECPINECFNVSVVVEWEQKGKTHQIQTQEDLFNWK